MWRDGEARKWPTRRMETARTKASIKGIEREREKKEKTRKAHMVAERTEGLSHLDVFG